MTLEETAILTRSYQVTLSGIISIIADFCFSLSCICCQALLNSKTMGAVMSEVDSDGIFDVMNLLQTFNFCMKFDSIEIFVKEHLRYHTIIIGVKTFLPEVNQL